MLALGLHTVVLGLQKAHHYNVCDDVDQYFSTDQRTVACYASAYVHKALKSAGAPNTTELARFLSGGDVHGVQVDPKLRQDYMQLRVDGDRLAASIQQLLQPSVLAAKQEDAIILGLFLLLFHDRTKYTGVSDAPSSADVPRVSEQAAVAGVHPRWWVLLLVLAPCGVVLAMRARTFVAETRDVDRREHRRLKRRDKQMDDDSDDDYR